MSIMLIIPMIMIPMIMIILITTIVGSPLCLGILHQGVVLKPASVVCA